MKNICIMYMSAGELLIGAILGLISGCITGSLTYAFLSRFLGVVDAIQQTSSQFTMGLFNDYLLASGIIGTITFVATMLTVASIMSGNDGGR